MKQLKESLLSGEKPAAPVAKVFEQDVVTLMDFRRSVSGTKKNLKGSEVLTADNLFTQMPALSKVIKKNITGESTGPTIAKAAFLRYIASQHINEEEIGGPLSGEVSKTTSGQPATYFIIHDTSSPTLGRGEADVSI